MHVLYVLFLVSLVSVEWCPEAAPNFLPCVFSSQNFFLNLSVVQGYNGQHVHTEVLG